MSEGMAIPTWAKEAKDQMVKVHGEIDYNKGGVSVRETNKLVDFSTFFGEYFERDDTLVIHLFPRGGQEDRYYPAEERDGKQLPGRLELSFSKIKFPEGMERIIKTAADNTWMGSVAIEPIAVLRYEDEDDVETAVPTEVETGSYVVQFQNVKTSAHIIGVPKFVDRFCEEVDKLLEE